MFFFYIFRNFIHKTRAKLVDEENVCKTVITCHFFYKADTLYIECRGIKAPPPPWDVSPPWVLAAPLTLSPTETLGNFFFKKEFFRLPFYQS